MVTILMESELLYHRIVSAQTAQITMMMHILSHPPDQFKGPVAWWRQRDSVATSQVAI